MNVTVQSRILSSQRSTSTGTVLAVTLGSILAMALTLSFGSSIKPTGVGDVALQFNLFMCWPLLYDLMEQYLKCYGMCLLVFQFYLLSLLNLTVFEVLHFMVALR